MSETSVVSETHCNLNRKFQTHVKIGISIFACVQFRLFLVSVIPSHRKLPTQRISNRSVKYWNGICVLKDRVSVPGGQNTGKTQVINY